MGATLQAVLFCVGVLGVAANSLMLAVVSRTKELRTHRNGLSINLAVADGLLALVLAGTSLARIVASDDVATISAWGAAEASQAASPGAADGIRRSLFCQVQGTVLNLLMLVSLATNTALALFHFHQLRPDKTPFTRGQHAAMIAGVWTVGSVLALAPWLRVLQSESPETDALAVYRLEPSGSFCFADFGARDDVYIAANAAHLAFALLAPWVALSAYFSMARTIPRFLFFGVDAAEEDVMGVATGISFGAGDIGRLSQRSITGGAYMGVKDGCGEKDIEAHAERGLVRCGSAASRQSATGSPLRSPMRQSSIGIQRCGSLTQSESPSRCPTRKVPVPATLELCQRASSLHGKIQRLATLDDPERRPAAATTACGHGTVSEHNKPGIAQVGLTDPDVNALIARADEHPSAHGCGARDANVASDDEDEVDEYDVYCASYKNRHTLHEAAVDITGHAPDARGRVASERAHHAGLSPPSSPMIRQAGASLTRDTSMLDDENSEAAVRSRLQSAFWLRGSTMFSLWLATWSIFALGHLVEMILPLGFGLDADANTLGSVLVCLNAMVNPIAYFALDGRLRGSVNAAATRLARAFCMRVPQSDSLGGSQSTVRVNSSWPLSASTKAIAASGLKK